MAIDSAHPLTPQHPLATDSPAQAILDALPDLIFLLDVGAGILTPQNAAAQPRTKQGEADAVSLEFSAVFPELEIAEVRRLEGAYLHTRFLASLFVSGNSTAAAVHAVVQVYPLRENQVAAAIAPAAETNSGAASGPSATDQHLILVVRPLASRAGLTPADFIPRDALNDAFHDPLTRLPNRRLFQRRLERAIHRRSRTDDYHCAVLFVDLDRFKAVNDRYGHLQGDKVLLAAAQRLVDSVRPQDMVARRDGDEFTILLDDLAHPDDAVGVADRILWQLQAPLLIEGFTDAGASMPGEISISASIGIALAAGNDSPATAEQWIARADAGMYHAKALGGGVFMTLDRSANAPGLSHGQGRPLPK